MDDYDVVIDALQKHRDRLWDMINRNVNSEYVPLNIMDDIRFYQVEQLDAAIDARKNSKPCQTCEALARTVMMDQTSHDTPPQREWHGLTDEEYEAMAEQYVTNCYFDTLKYAKGIEAKLKEKNG